MLSVFLTDGTVQIVASAQDAAVLAEELRGA